MQDPAPPPSAPPPGPSTTTDAATATATHAATATTTVPPPALPPSTTRPLTAGPASGPAAPFPLQIRGRVSQGFGRGSKELGIPTANLPVEGLRVGGREDVDNGVYFGWAGLEEEEADTTTTAKAPAKASADASASATVYPMVMSIGWNPYYKNSVRSVEVHLLATFPRDFYGARLRVLVAGYIRPERDYGSREALVADIHTDIEVARRSLAREPYRVLGEDRWLVDFAEGEGEGEGEVVS
ncbi:MAG: riboflavin kinase [Phylliscum demangeonii]|nr:MAG: riboflavin kinase [Phylliscum demangeonii]